MKFREGMMLLWHKLKELFMARRRNIVGAELFVGPKAKIPKLAKKSRSKFHNRITVVHGIKFHSMGEAGRYEELFLQQRNGLIRNLQLQRKYALHALDGTVVAHYIADFVYEEKNEKNEFVEIVEDFKGVLTDIYKLKRKWMKAEHGIIIRETFSKVRKKKR
jgi:hypothetical protein